VISEVLVRTLEGLKLKFPSLSRNELKQLEEGKQKLMGEKR
jgi:hypothetical protein